MRNRSLDPRLPNVLPVSLLIGSTSINVVDGVFVVVVLVEVLLVLRNFLALFFQHVSYLSELICFCISFGLDSIFWLIFFTKSSFKSSKKLQSILSKLLQCNRFKRNKNLFWFNFSRKYWKISSCLGQYFGPDMCPSSAGVSSPFCLSKRQV